MTISAPALATLLGLTTK